MGALQRIRVVETTQVGKARRHAMTLAASFDFNETQIGKIALIVTEAANNLVKHGGGGDILIGRCSHPTLKIVFQILALDRGPGMADVVDCMKDGFSTAGTPGTGLGAMSRLSDEFDLYSRPQQGTALYSAVGIGTRSLASESQSDASFDWGAVCVPHPKEDTSGDQWTTLPSANRCLVMIADGLGHGPLAAEAAAAAVEIIEHKGEGSVENTLANIHSKLRSTRGAALAIAEVLPAEHKVRFVGIGNISAGIFSWDQNQRQRMVSLNGIVGHQISRLRAYEYSWPKDGILLMHSDGLSSKCCDLESYPGLYLKKTPLIAGVLYRDFTRGTDDASVVVLRQRSSHG